MMKRHQEEGPALSRSLLLVMYHCSLVQWVLRGIVLIQPGSLVLLPPPSLQRQQALRVLILVGAR
jgi:hypothetical protein